MPADPTPSDTHRAVLLIEYDGTGFRGWARQPDQRTVEGELRTALAERSVEVDELRCAGRTDAGVHARAQVASITYRGAIEPARLAPSLNQRLPADLAIIESATARDGFDAREDALSRAYEYRVLPARMRSPLRRSRTLHHPRPLDTDLLERCAALICGKHDFTAFTPSRTEHVFFHRTVLESRWRAVGDELRYDIRANAFLRHMVRTLVGSMLAIARGEAPIESLERLLAGASRAEAHYTAPAHPLTLVDVEYPEDPFAARVRSARHREGAVIENAASGNN